MERLDIEHEVSPEHELCRRVAHLVKGRMVKTAPPRALLGVPLSQTGVRRGHGITVVGVQRPQTSGTHATGDTVPSPGDPVIVSGQLNTVQRFGGLRWAPRGERSVRPT